ncbi:FAD-dependent monooxygenase [Streptomyces sp. V3I7]|uniref:FAD-dependent monooxygenase n=1 Tax=Streptomyces sp. V3I7 TaxID=3042278 RepID=UPI0027890BEB|nr:FAD-dependent monooxygenase [Streptomyces sp. V3I7]MDQ0989093.1 2-polyprenyl-6-methoxyphenol hydroxylase-like FAD-dependent oxidoreductase [Streptomyces sp. V3I7]
METLAEIKTETETEVEVEVVIAGAGPTGLMLAYELTLAGVETLVLEKLPQRVEQVKGGAIQPRTAELLESRGLLEPLLHRVTSRDPAGGHFAMLPVPLDCTPWRTRHPYTIGIPQWEIEEVLENHATAAGARILRGIAFSGVESYDDGVIVKAEGLKVRARYLVACDGGHSTVRKQLGLPFPGRPGTHQAVLADIRLSAASSLVPQQTGHISTLTRRAGSYWSMLVPLGDDRYRFTFGRTDETDQTDHTDHTSNDRDAPITHAEIAAALQAVYGDETTLCAVDNSSRFSDATRQLENYRAGRVLFAGDAAHIHPPLGGQGLNLGIQDAFNLGWKLAAAVQGRAPSNLLDSYHAERHPVGAQVLHHTSAQRVLADPNPSEDVAALRDIFTDLLRLPDTNRHMAGLISGLSLRYALPGEHPLTGQRMPDTDLLTEAGPARLSALLTSGHAVLLDLAKAVPADLRLPPQVDFVRATCPDDVGATAVLIRPDGYVCWATSGSTADDDALLAATTSTLTTVR